MKQLNFAPEQIEQLTRESIYDNHPIVRRRCLALLLKAHGHTRAQVATVLAIDVSTVRAYFDLFLEEGIAALKRLNYHGKRNALQEREKDILAALEAKPPATVKEAQDTIKTATDLCRSWTRVKEFLRRNKVRRRKVKALPDKANVDAQEAFKTSTLEPLVEEAQQSKIHLFFVDASHFVLRPFLGYLYSRTVRFLKSSSRTQGVRRTQALQCFGSLACCHPGVSGLFGPRLHQRDFGLCAVSEAARPVPGFALGTRLGQCPLPKARSSWRKPDS